MIQDFITLESLASFTTLIFILVLVTEFTKRLIDQVFKIKTDLLVFIYSLILINLLTFAENGFSEDIIITIVLNIINALVISYLTTSSYAKIIENNKENVEEIATQKFSVKR